MHDQPIFALQALESRRLLHAGPHVGVGGGNSVLDDCPEVIDARAAMKDAVTQLLAAQRAGRKTLKADRAAIVDELKQLADDIGQDAMKDALAPLKEKLRADEKAKFKELRNAAETLRITKRAGRQLLAADLKALHEAHQSGDQTAIDDAKAKLKADKESLSASLKPIRDNIIAIKDKWRPIITADHEAVETKLEALNPDLVPLFDKLENDTEALQQKLEDGHGKVADANQDLKVAIADCLAQHAAGVHTA
ncbi:MAG: hypothetical protein QOF78_3164 [Phycisphaerales bacterium]|jgi:hypothetical protein|nr:hypothetical protein [Phycisphaerales bacterium]